MHRNNFDGLRLIGALLVIVSHAFALSGRWEPVVDSRSLGHVGVLLFFTVSGYLVTKSWLRDPDPWRFIVRRSLRIFPGLLVASLLAPFVVDWLGQTGFVRNTYHALNGSLWTIKYEVACYALLVVTAVAAGPRLAHVGAAALLVGMAAYFGATTGTFADRWLIYFGSFFLAGGLLNFVTLRPVHVLLALGFGAWLYAYDYPSVGVLVALCPLVIWTGLQSWPVLRSAGRFGDFSYGIYIYGYPVQQLVVVWLGDAAPYWMHLAATATIATACGVLSWKLVESPALRLKGLMVRQAIESRPETQPAQ